MLFKEFIGEQGKLEGKCFERYSAVNWSDIACQLRELTDKFRVCIESEDWSLIIAASSSSQGDQSKLGGPEESLFEHSLGVGREEMASHCCCCPKLKQVLSLNRLVLVTVNGWMLCQQLLNGLVMRVLQLPVIESMDEK